ncbi:MAG: tRNA glutamyl-Q(34) synthetase GluQRS [Gammaproteobacteria bacterium]|nr:tRNA glutamyl-Q(34) synthetase GluQRS [Gammaproteobacteria bacterium]
MLNTSYTGRFAPTPSGPLHFGSIVAALASYLDARHHGGRWLLRIEDIDTPRVRRGADRKIIDTLEILGLEWDGDIVYQSERIDHYQRALALLRDKDLLYRCYCPRRLTKGKPYPGTCRAREEIPGKPYALRVKTSQQPVSFADAIQGRLAGRLIELTGDFILRRSDGLIAYNLAVVVDDAAQGVTHIVRGADLLDTTFNQVYLQSVLNLPAPGYAHHPLVLDERGKKVSKQDGATDVLAGASPETVLLQSLGFLGQNPDQELKGAGKRDILAWAVDHWTIEGVRR